MRLKIKGGYKWCDSNINVILTNITYTGNMLFQKEYIEDPITKKCRKNKGELPQYLVENTHEAIIDPNVFEMVQREIERRGKGKKYHSGVRPFSSRIKCDECGCWYGSKVWHSNSKYRKVIWHCNHKYDGDKTCCTPHLTDNEIQAAFLTAFEKLSDQLTEFTLDSWNGLPDYATVYAEDDIRFTFKNGQEVKA